MSTRPRIAAALATAAAAGASVAGLAFTAPHHGAHEPVPRALPRAAPAGVTSMFGHIRTQRRSGGRWLMRFDPALLLRGVAAERAAVADGAIRPGEPVPNAV